MNKAAEIVRTGMDRRHHQRFGSSWSPRVFSVQLPLSDHIQRSDHIAQRVCRHADSSCEKKERCDDHSDSDESELATSPAFSVFWTRNRKNLDEESDHVATGGQHHPPLQSTGRI